MNQLDHEKKDAITAKNCEPSNFAIENPLFYPNYVPYPYQPYHYEFMGRGEERGNPRRVAIEVALSLFLDSLGKIQAKERLEAELLLGLFVECLNKNYQLLNDERTTNKEVKRYTAEYNCDCIFRIASHFLEEFLPEVKEAGTLPYSFFLSHSFLITSNSEQKVLNQLREFLFSQKMPQEAPNLQPQAQLQPQSPSNPNPQHEVKNNEDNSSPLHLK
jgi:hypothetical protein